MWNNLSISEKAELIRASVKAGNNDLNKIIDDFNSFSKEREQYNEIPVQQQVQQNNMYSVVPKLDYYKDPNEPKGNKFDKGGKKDKLTKGGMKDIAYAIMAGKDNESSSSGTGRSWSEIVSSFFNRTDIVNNRDKIPNNLSSLYIYGNDLGQYTEKPEWRNVGVEYDNYIKNSGRNPEDIKTYAGNIVNFSDKDGYMHMDESVSLPDVFTKDDVLNYVNSANNKTFSRYKMVEDGLWGDDVGGYLTRISNVNGIPMAVHSDIWDFDKSYTKKYEGVDDWQVEALDKVGNPFILKQLTPIMFEDSDTWYPKNDLEKEIAKELGLLPEVVVTGKKHQNGGPFTVGSLVNAIDQNTRGIEKLGQPDHNYNFAISEEEADALGYYPDERGHRDDRVKLPAHPSHPSKGTWQGDNFILTDKGMEDPNYIFYGLADGGQDPQATLIYDDSILLPEITVTPKENYFYNSYDNIINKFDDGGYIKQTNISDTDKHDVEVIFNNDTLSPNTSFIRHPNLFTLGGNKQNALQSLQDKGLYTDNSDYLLNRTYDINQQDIYFTNEEKNDIINKVNRTVVKRNNRHINPSPQDVDAWISKEIINTLNKKLKTTLGNDYLKSNFKELYQHENNDYYEYTDWYEKNINIPADFREVYTRTYGYNGKQYQPTLKDWYNLEQAFSKPRYETKLGQVSTLVQLDPKDINNRQQLTQFLLDDIKDKLGVNDFTLEQQLMEQSKEKYPNLHSHVIKTNSRNAFDDYFYLGNDFDSFEDYSESQGSSWNTNFEQMQSKQNQAKSQLQAKQSLQEAQRQQELAERKQKEVEAYVNKLNYLQKLQDIGNGLSTNKHTQALDFLGGLRQPTYMDPKEWAIHTKQSNEFGQKYIEYQKENYQRYLDVIDALGSIWSLGNFYTQGLGRSFGNKSADYFFSNDNVGVRALSDVIGVTVPFTEMAQDNFENNEIPVSEMGIQASQIVGRSNILKSLGKPGIVIDGFIDGIGGVSDVLNVTQLENLIKDAVNGK